MIVALDIFATSVGHVDVAAEFTEVRVAAREQVHVLHGVHRRDRRFSAAKISELTSRIRIAIKLFVSENVSIYIHELNDGRL